MSRRAINKLVDLAINKLKEDYPTVPEYAIPKPKYTDKTSNGLTACVIDFINYSGGLAERRNSTGRYIQGKSYKNVFGKEVQLTKGKYIKSSGRIGTSDVSGVFRGVPISVEVKIGRDKLSPEQKKYKEDFENAGGWHCVARSFEQFYVEFKKAFSHDY